MANGTLLLNTLEKSGNAGLGIQNTMVLAAAGQTIDFNWIGTHTATTPTTRATINGVIGNGSGGGSFAVNFNGNTTGFGSSWRLGGQSTYTGATSVTQTAVTPATDNALPTATTLNLGTNGIYNVTVSTGINQRIGHLAGIGFAEFNISSRITVGAGSASTTDWLTLNGGSISPGASGNGTGTLTVRNSNTGSTQTARVALTSGTLAIDLNSDTAFDVLAISTANSTANSILTLNGGDTSGGGSMNLSVALGYLPSIGTLFRIIDLEEDAANGALITGKFTQVDTVVSSFGSYDVTFNILYNSSLGGGDGNDVVLEVADIDIIPEPASLALLAAGSALMACRRRRR